MPGKPGRVDMADARQVLLDFLFLAEGFTVEVEGHAYTGAGSSTGASRRTSSPRSARRRSGCVRRVE
ncbi:hypothetical protein ABT097_15705 [Streptomyces sp. NPDC002225]|uniref:hypothetical protein n=1 Tax=Streptomyces sp. NPDC002225 TaxID=3154413 RepID=UPI00332DBE95